MSVLIKDMEKPKYCYAVIDGESEYCPFVNTDDDCVLLLKKGICEGTWEEQYSKCPLVKESERLTDDDFETIRIHLNAQKEKLCNQQRWEEAEEYQRIIDRFIAFASAEQEPKHISYMECANAMLKMWIDNVLTDGEYNRIMEKLNSKHMTDMRGEQE